MRSVAAAIIVTLAWLAIAAAPPTRRWSDRHWAIALVAILAITYAGQALSMTIFYGGGQGDDRYQLAFVESIAQGHIFGDYFYGDVIGHYPPLVFWVGGLIEAVSGADSTTALRWLPLIMIPATAALVAWSAVRVKSSPSLSIIIAFGLGSFLVSYLTNFGPTRGLWGLTILKPQQVAGGAMAVALPALIASRSHLRRRSRLAAGCALIAGIALTIPLYLPIAVGAAGTVLLRENRRRTGSDGEMGMDRSPVQMTLAGGRVLPSPAPSGGWRDLAICIAGGAVLSSFYWIPLAAAILSGNWHNNYLYWQSVESLDPSRWTVGFAFGVPIVGGILAIRRYNDSATWGLAAIALLSAMIYASAYVTYPLFGISLLAWWAPIPAAIALSILAARYVRDWLELRFRAGPIQVSFRKARWPAVMLVSALLLPLINWTTLTDAQLERSHDAFDIDLIDGSRILRAELSREQTFITGSEGLLLSGMSGRSLTVVPHAFYANPMGRTEERRQDVEALLADPNCQRTRELADRWRMGALAAEVIPTVGAPSAGSGSAGGGNALPSLGISFLDPVRNFSPEKVGDTTYVSLSPAINSQACWRLAYRGETLVIYVVRSD